MSDSDMTPGFSGRTLAKLWYRLLRRLARRNPPTMPPVLLLVEGLHDAEFLRRISRILHQHNPSLPSIGPLESTAAVIVLPLGGNGPQPWLEKLGPLGKAAFYLFDREMPPESELRRLAVKQLDNGQDQRAFLTTKRSLECYLHAEAIEEVFGFQVTVGDDDPMPEKVAQARLAAKGIDRDWGMLSYRTRKRLREQAKRRLNREAVNYMTPERLADRDSADEVKAWLRTIQELLDWPFM